ncbi:MAG: hypothetical protein J6K61_00605 [Clostridia bacterium]|nr:hypothetical protein [Clostridia bacterium]
MKYSIDKLVEAATLYYKYEYTQQEIAKKLNLSRQTVISMLAEAKKQNIIEIKINNPLEESKELSSKLKEMYNLSEAIVLPYTSMDENLISLFLADRATEHINRLIGNGNKKIGIGWGRTVCHFINAFTRRETENTVVFPLMGATDHTQPYFMSNELARNFVEKISAKTQYAYVPANPSDSKDSDLFKKTASYAMLHSLWESIDIAIVGLGMNPSLEKLVRDRYPGEDTLKITSSIVGDVCINYFDINGKLVDIGPEMIHASLAEFAKAKRVVAIAGGASKFCAIKGALSTGVITDIILDMGVCEKLLEKS